MQDLLARKIAQRTGVDPNDFEKICSNHEPYYHRQGNFTTCIIPLPATGGFAVGVTKRRPPVSRRMNGTKRLIGDEHNLDIAKTIALARAYRDLAIGIHNPNRILSWRET